MKSLLRFGIRDLLWAMLVVGLGISLIMQYRSLAKERSRAEFLRFAIDCATLDLKRFSSVTFSVDEDGRSCGTTGPSRENPFAE